MKSYIKKTGLVLVLAGAIAGCDVADVNNQNHTSQNNSQPASNSLSANQKGAFSNITTKLDTPAFGGVDTINGMVAPKSGTTIPITGDKIEIAGNYVDDIKKDVASGVVVMIDGKPFEATYGGERPDIAKSLNNPKYLKSQFYFSIPTSEIGKGLHEVKIRVIANDKSGYYESPWVGKIDVK